MARKTMDVHAKCLATGMIDGLTVICRKSAGHTDTATDLAHREHFDPSADVRWLEEGAKVWITYPNSITADRDAVVVSDDGSPKVTVKWRPRRQIRKGRDHSRANYTGTGAWHTQKIERARLEPRRR
jgi:hypothetical protein